MIMANPAINQIPAFREYCEKNGISPFHLTVQQTEQLQQAGGQAGEPVGQPKKDRLSAAIDVER